MPIHTLTIADPHKDIDLSVGRDPLQFRISLPEAGVNAETGLIVYIGGFASRFDDPYANNLLGYLSNTYNCVVTSVDYFDSCVTRGFDVVPAADFFLRLKECHGVGITAPAGADIGAVFHYVIKAIRAKGLDRLDDRCQVEKVHPRYLSFGIMPALDVLTAVHRILGAWPINLRRTFLLGTSYGGYIGMIIAKFAPNTFRLIIDNSGFSGSDDVPSAIYGWSAVELHGVRMTGRSRLAFSPLPGTANWFSPDRKAIRDLAAAEHYGAESETRIIAYHSASDDIAPTARKTALAAVLAGRRRYSLTVIGENDIDGRVFKNTAHGMSASMRGLFAAAYERWRDEGAAGRPTTDFADRTRQIFRCDGGEYHIRFDDGGVRMDRRPR